MCEVVFAVGCGGAGGVGRLRLAVRILQRVVLAALPEFRFLDF